MFHYISYFFEHDYESKYLFSYQEKQYISIYSKRFHKTRRITPAKETFLIILKASINFKKRYPQLAFPSGFCEGAFSPHFEFNSNWFNHFVLKTNRVDFVTQIDSFSHLLPGWAYHSTCFAIHTAGPEIHCRAQGRLTLFLSSILAEDA